MNPKNRAPRPPPSVRNTIKDMLTPAPRPGPTEQATLKNKFRRASSSSSAPQASVATSMKKQDISQPTTILKKQDTPEPSLVERNTIVATGPYGRRFKPSSGGPQLMKPGCWASLMKLPSTKKRCQAYVWELLNILGVADGLAHPSDLGPDGYPRAQMDAIWTRVGCLPAFWAGDTCVIGGARQQYALARGVANVAQGSAPHIDNIVPFIECPSCGATHNCAVFVTDMLMLGSGYLNDKIIDWMGQRISDLQQPQRSHLCSVSWCINAIHIFIEICEVNEARKACVGHLGVGCSHNPPCAKGLFQQNDNIDKLTTLTISLRQLHDTVGTDVPGVTYECSTHNLYFTSLAKYLDHLTQDLDHRSSEAEVSAALSLFCPCEKNNLTGSGPTDPRGVLRNHKSAFCPPQATHGYTPPLEKNGKIYRPRRLLRYFKDSSTHTLDPEILQRRFLTARTTDDVD